LGIHEHVSAGEIKLPPAFKLLTPFDAIVVTVEASKTARALEVAAVPAEEVQPELVREAEPAEGATE
jgi:hypothetical protein